MQCQLSSACLTGSRDDGDGGKFSRSSGTIDHRFSLVTDHHM